MSGELPPIPPYSMGWDEETVYILRSDVATAEEALAAFRRISAEEFSMQSEDYMDIEPVAQTVPSHAQTCVLSSASTTPKSGRSRHDR
jgi:hypothetical protein